MDKVTKLRGGSLNSTCLHEGNFSSFVRKTISTNKNREYGYVRWYSQLKKLQRYHELFPKLTPQVINVGVNEHGAYFDIEYISNAKDIKTLFVNDELSDKQINDMHLKLWESFDQIHCHTYKANTSSLMLYFAEEVEQKLKDARQFPEFESFYQINNYDYQGTVIPGLKTNYDKFKNLFYQPVDVESYVHGNPTLENILYSPADNKITFIDLYEEGIVDSKFMDYSQILQCSNSYYGIYNDSVKEVNGNKVSCCATVPKNLKKFNDMFVSELSSRYSTDHIKLVKLFEATQFFRMLPFKCHAGDITAAKFFYAHACYLVNQLI